MAAMEARPQGMSPERLRATTPSPPLTDGSNSPVHSQSPSQTTIEAQQRRQQRHSKRLSINFPILVPTRGNDTPNSMYTASPTALAPHSMTHGAFFSPPTSHAAVPSSIAIPMPLTPPSEEDGVVNIGLLGRGHVRQESTSTEFLTMLASQERRVLELKEELARAENELTRLKKQWAMYEAGKKKGEIKGMPVRMASVKTKHAHARAASVVEVGTGLGLSGMEDTTPGDGKIEAERERMRELVRERMLGRVPNSETNQSGQSNSKKGQRVFSSSRHARTLSLLTTATTTSERTSSLESVTHGKNSLDAARQPVPNTPISSATPSMPTLTRSNSTLEALNLGRTYKDLATAASKKGLPQGLSPEQFVKQGKQMVDDVKDGLWNFFEDIRQATVGDEAVSSVRRQNSMKQYHGVNTGNAKLKRTTTDASLGKDNNDANEPSFWKEFGVDTPKSDKAKRGEGNKAEDIRPSLPGRWPSTKTGDDLQTVKNSPKRASRKKKSRDLDATHRKTVATTNRPGGPEHHASKSSTDSQHPPSLVDDDEDETWETWDSHSLLDPDSPGHERRRGARQDKSHDAIGNAQWHGLIH